MSSSSSSATSDPNHSFISNLSHSAHEYGALALQTTSNFYGKAKEEGELNQKVEAVLRTCISIVSISSQPEVAAIAAVVSVVKPNLVNFACNGIDKGLTKFWYSLTFNQKVSVFALGLMLLYFNFRIISIPTSIFSAKYGAQQALENLEKSEDNPPIANPATIEKKES